jgi:S-DNA-T family DNA segregation ATPase FtsK/SpoIIIE
MGSGVYRPRPRGAAMTDALAEARIALARLTQIAILRGAGALVLLAALAVALALATYSSGDPSLNNATGRPVDNWLGPLGATAADVLLQAFGIAAFAFLAPLAVWGGRAMMGKGLSRAVSRAVAWPLGTVLVAAGLGMLPPPQSLPAGAGGWIGIAASNLSKYAGQVYGQHWIGWALPLSARRSSARLHRDRSSLLARRAPCRHRCCGCLLAGQQGEIAEGEPSPRTDL